MVDARPQTVPSTEIVPGRSSAGLRMALQFVILSIAGGRLFLFHGISLYLTPRSQAPAIVKGIVKYVYKEDGPADSTVVLFLEPAPEDVRPRLGVLVGAVLLFLAVDGRYGIEAALLLVILPAYFVYKALAARGVLFVATTGLRPCGRYVGVGRGRFLAESVLYKRAGTAPAKPRPRRPKRAAGVIERVWAGSSDSWQTFS